jgi:hypothetical protein
MGMEQGISSGASLAVTLEAPVVKVPVLLAVKAIRASWVVSSSLLASSVP